MRCNPASLLAALMLCGPSPSVAYTEVSGAIPTTTWTKDGSPYRVVGEIDVPQGHTLTIGPGVSVLFDAAVPFTVHGALETFGTIDENVTFTEGKSIWRGLELLRHSEPCYMSNTVISKSRERSTKGDVHGGGLLVSGARALLKDCVVDGNVAETYSSRYRPYGGGIAVVAGGDLTLVDCTVRNNQSTDCFYYPRDYIVSSCMASAGGVYVGIGGHVAMRRCVIRSNYTDVSGAGVLVGSTSRMDARNTFFVGNDVYNDTNPVAGGPVETRVARGSAVAVGNSGIAVLVNCTITGNSAGPKVPTGRGAISGPVMATNCIIWGNTPDSVGGGAITYSNVESGDGVYPGEGNISTDPQLDPLSYDLLPGSPCIDAGDPESERDLDGSVADIGVGSSRDYSPDIVASRAVTVARGETRNLRILNMGDGELVVSDLILPSSFAANETSFPLTVPPTSIVKVPIGFDGTSDTLTTMAIVHSDPSKPSLEVSLRGSMISPIAEPESSPASLTLDQNTPNPFNPLTTIRFSIAESGLVSLTIYDVNGRRVRTLVDGLSSAGYQSVVWDGTDSRGRPVASGVYLYRLTHTGTNMASRASGNHSPTNPNEVRVRRMLLVR